MSQASKTSQRYTKPEDLTPYVFNKKRAEKFNYPDLFAEFVKCCPDAASVPIWDEKSKALQVATEILFKIGPEAKSIKKSREESDKVWKLRIARTVNNEEIESVLFIATYNNSPAPTKVPKFENNQLILTVNQAGLVAVNILCKYIPLMVEKSKIILTPLAGAVFAKTHIENMAKTFYGHDANEAELAEILIKINCSCQTDGFCLTESDATIASAAVHYTTRYCEPEVRNSIISTTLKKYKQAGKEVDKDLYTKIEPFANGGLPVGLSTEILIKKFEEAQIIGRAKRRAEAEREEQARQAAMVAELKRLDLDEQSGSKPKNE